MAVMDEHSMIWLGLRERRASLRDRSLLKDSSGRRATFAAAMQQFEEQMTAAKVVTAATRPINLYYGLAQAGLAILAAHAPDQWSFSKHGLKLLDTEPPLADICVRSDGNGAFQAVAGAVGSPIITTPVSLGALWASLPDLCESALLPDSSHPPALALLVETSPYTLVNPSAPDGSYTSYSIPSPPPPLRASVWVNDDLPEPDQRLAWLRQLMSAYPSADGWLLPADDPDVIRQVNTRRVQVTLEWLRADPSRELSEAELGAFFDTIALEHRYQRDRYLRPSVEGSAAPAPSSLMTWWLLLYSLSMLARYQPRKWLALLALDSSLHATSLQYALEVALTVVPHLVLAALDRKPLLLREPLAL